MIRAGAAKLCRTAPFIFSNILTNVTAKSKIASILRVNSNHSDIYVLLLITVKKSMDKEIRALIFISSENHSAMFIHSHIETCMPKSLKL